MSTFQVGDTVGFNVGEFTVWGTVAWLPSDGLVVTVKAPNGQNFFPLTKRLVGKTQDYS